MSADALRTLGRRGGTGEPAGIVSVCSAHPLVIEAALRQAASDGGPALIEATCNQVNQHGGYTGLTPAAFRAMVEGIADGVGFPRARLVLGGDHLGPNPWRHLPADEAMRHAADMISAYAEAGFRKLHLDCSMGCLGEAEALDDETTASRAAVLASRAEASGGTPVYVIGTEVPTPGGAREALDHLRPTPPEAVSRTREVHARAFRDLPEAWSRVIAIVVQPGVEFGPDSVAVYAPEAARALVAARGSLGGDIVYEAHSTDYQPVAALRALVADGFAILKVGPWLTFAMREALYGLDAIASVLHPDRTSLRDTMEAVMRADPSHWARHVPGTPDEQRIGRHFGYSDRIRYYWPAPEAERAVDALFAVFTDRPIPPTLLGQYLPRAADAVAAGACAPLARTIVIEAVRDVLRAYARATAPLGETEGRSA